MFEQLVVSRGNLDGFIPAHLLHHIVHATAGSTFLSYEEVLVRLCVGALQVYCCSKHEQVSTFVIREVAMLMRRGKRNGVCKKRARPKKMYDVHEFAFLDVALQDTSNSNICTIHCRPRKQSGDDMNGNSKRSWLPNKPRKCRRNFRKTVCHCLKCAHVDTRFRVLVLVRKQLPSILDPGGQFFDDPNAREGSSHDAEAKAPKINKYLVDVEKLEEESSNDNPYNTGNRSRVVKKKLKPVGGGRRKRLCL